MLSNKPVYPTLPVVDLARARKFYEEKLGLKVVMEDPAPGLALGAGEGTVIYLYQRGMTKADHTVAEFKVDDVDAEVRELKNKGIIFEEYDIPSMGIKTVAGIANMGSGQGTEKAAWFKDTEGNILAIGQMAKASMRKMM